MDFGLTLAKLPMDELLRIARSAEDAGFSALYVPDHWVYENPGGGLSDTANSWEAMTILGALAAVTSRARIGALVHCNLYRHPATTAQAITTLDHVSGGRAVLGIGSGWTRAEFDCMGMEFPEVKARLRRLDEAIRIARSLWTKPRTDFDGEFYRLADAFLVPGPVQSPHPPILLGGSGKGALRIAAREADHVNIIADSGRAGTILLSEVAKVTEDAFRAKVDFVRAEARAAGRDPDSLTLSSTVFMARITHDEEAVEQFVSGMAAMFGVSPGEYRRMPMVLAGTPQQCAEELRRRAGAWGVSHYILGGDSGPAQAGIFGREVAPRV